MRSLGAGGFAALLAGCVAGGELPDAPATPPASEVCADSLAPGEVAEVASGLDDGTRGVAFAPDGRLFVTHGDAIEQIFPDGSREVLGTVPAASGLEWWGGRLAIVSSDRGAPDGAGAVYRMDAITSETTLFVEPLPGAEAATITPWRSLVVSSPTVDEEIVEVLNNGGLDGFIQEVPSPFGVGFAPDATAVWVASLLADPAPLLRFPLDGEEPGLAEPVAEWTAGAGPAEIVVSTTDDAVYVALSGSGRVARIDGDTYAETNIVSDVDGVTGLALGVAPDWDPCALYLTSPSSDRLLAVGVSR